MRALAAGRPTLGSRSLFSWALLRLTLVPLTLSSLAVFSLTLSCLSVPRSAWADPPTQLDVPEDAGRPAIPGETPPPPDARLPTSTPVPPSSPKPAPPVPEPTAPPVAPPPPPPRPAPPWQPTHAFQLEVGPMWMPDGVFGLLSRFDKHPQLRGTAIDLSWWSPLARDRWLAARLGLGLPDVPAVNWYESTAVATPDPANTAWRALYTQVQMVTLDLAVDYIGHVPLADRLDWTWRVGLGLAIQVGSVELTETLPTCTQPQQATCPHWRRAGRGTASIPVVLPMLRATTGLAWRLTESVSVGVEGGLRDVLWTGGSVVMQY